MLDVVPESHEDLLKNETKAFAFLATTMEDGTPQVTPVWFNVKGDQIWINSAEGRTKDKNMQERPHVALAIIDPQRPYHYVQMRGEVVEITAEGGDAHIHELSHKYRGKDYSIPEGQIRKIYKIRPDAANTM